MYTAYKKSLYNNKILFFRAETASINPGYGWCLQSTLPLNFKKKTTNKLFLEKIK
jgi:hypothetical protein